VCFALVTIPWAQRNRAPPFLTTSAASERYCQQRGREPKSLLVRGSPRSPGVETQRQWSALAIARTTPGLLALFSFITLLAYALLDAHALPIRSAAWYAKPLPTFSDAIAWPRTFLWQETFLMSPADPDIVKVPRSLDTLGYASCMCKVQIRGWCGQELIGGFCFQQADDAPQHQPV
jgi:hypothetical protein